MAKALRLPYLFSTVALFLGIALCGIYWPGLHGSFFFDDIANILTAENLRLDTLSAASLAAVIAKGHDGLTGRPIAELSFALNYYASGFDPFFFKLTNLAIHGLNATLIFFLVQRLLPSAKQRGDNANLAAGLLAAVWLLHPIQLLPVLHVVQRMTSLSAFFLIAGLLLHIRSREDTANTSSRLALAWLICWPLSFLSKETGALFPVFALAWELILHRKTAGGLDRFARGFVILAGLAATAALAYALLPQGQWLWAGYNLRSFSLIERLLTEGRVLWFYIGLILFPRLGAFGVHHDDIVISTGILAPWTTLPALGGLITLAWLTCKLRNRAPLISFGITWFLLGHSIESTVLPLEIAHEHRNYLPLFGILLAITAGLIHTKEINKAPKIILVALTAAAITYLPLVTALRAHQFGDEVRRTQMEAQHHDQSAKAQHEAGRTLANLPEAAQKDSPAHLFARTYYEKAGEIDPYMKLSWLGLIHLSCKASLPVERAWVDKLGWRLEHTPFSPGDRNVLYALKEMSIANSICLSRNDVDGLFAAALANSSVSPRVKAMLHSWHADFLWLHEHDLVASSSALKQALGLDPANSSNRLKWAQLLFLAGETEATRAVAMDLHREDLSSEEQRTLKELLTASSMIAR